MADKSQKGTLSSPRTRAVGARNPPQRHSVGTPRRRQRDTRYVTKKEMRGGEMQVPSNPPGINHQPWFQTTVVHAGVSGDITIKVSDLISQLVRQLDPHGHGFAPSSANNSLGPVVNIRVRSIRAWNLSGRMVALSVDDYSDTEKAISDVDTLCGLVDTGSSAHIPAVGYELPESHKNIVLRNGSDKSTDRDAVIYHVVSAANDAVIIYTSIYWKFDGPAKFSAFHNQMLASVRRIERSANNIDRTLEIMKENAEECDHGSTIVDGVRKIAPFVIATAASSGSVAMLDRIHELEERIRHMSIVMSDHSDQKSLDGSSFDAVDEE